jgi:hypothetical protein
LNRRLLQCPKGFVTINIIGDGCGRCMNLLIHYTFLWPSDGI